VDLIREAKASGTPVTAETAPHYFALTEDALLSLPAGQRARAKMNPPLRTEADRLAVIEGLCDGTIDVIATDHAPHEAELKRLPVDEAPFGITGLETAFAVSYTELVLSGRLTLRQLTEKMSAAPARLIGLPDRGVIEEGAVADLTIVDITTPHVIDSKTFDSRGKSTPFEGKKTRGKIRMTLCAGVAVSATPVPSV
jgi:dihydroorotase